MESHNTEATQAQDTLPVAVVMDLINPHLVKQDLGPRLLQSEVVGHVHCIVDPGDQIEIEIPKRDPETPRPRQRGPPTRQMQIGRSHRKQLDPLNGPTPPNEPSHGIQFMLTKTCHAVCGRRDKVPLVMRKNS